jgi:hypothetical protein
MNTAWRGRKNLPFQRVVPSMHTSAVIKASNDEENMMTTHQSAFVGCHAATVTKALKTTKAKTVNRVVLDDGNGSG